MSEVSADLPAKGLLRWRCRRGMRELDAALLAYLENHFDQAPLSEQRAFCDLLDIPDPELIRLVARDSGNIGAIAGYGISQITSGKTQPEMEAGPYASGNYAAASNGLQNQQGSVRNDQKRQAGSQEQKQMQKQPDTSARFQPIIDKIRSTLIAD